MSSIKNPFNFIKKANKSFNLFLKNYNKIERFLDSYEEDFIKLGDLFHSYSISDIEFKNAIQTYNKSYNNSKDYFFNGQEDLFRNFMDTDHFFQFCFFNNIHLLSFSPTENKIYLKTSDGVVLLTNNRYLTLEDIYGKDGYGVPQLYQLDEFVVFDIGMNRGYATLKFANFDSCKAVYGFEIDPDTYKMAMENFKLNPNISHKIKPYNIGLSDKQGFINLYSIPGRDGITTTELEFIDNQSEWISSKDRMEVKKAEIKVAGEVISNIINTEKISSPMVLKIDTEGAEFKIINDLNNKGILHNFHLIMGEMHLKSGNIDGMLDGYKCLYKKDFTDTIYSFCYVKEEHFEKLPLAE